MEGTALSKVLVFQYAFDMYLKVLSPDIIADNSSEFLGKEFREVI